LGASRRLAEAFQLACFGGGPLTPDERALVAKAGLAQDSVVQIEGDDDLLASCYRHARLFVFPSEYEGFGMPLTEAMVQSCPIACSQASSFPEIAGAAAAYFDPLDVDSMRTAIEAIALDDGRHAELAAKSGQRAAGSDVLLATLRRRNRRGVPACPPRRAGPEPMICHESVRESPFHGPPRPPLPDPCLSGHRA
jgi:glycosyltransferase involved in cell wall biosynthesis